MYLPRAPIFPNQPHTLSKAARQADQTSSESILSVVEFFSGAHICAAHANYRAKRGAAAVAARSVGRSVWMMVWCI